MIDEKASSLFFPTDFICHYISAHIYLSVFSGVFGSESFREQYLKCLSFLVTVTKLNFRLHVDLKVTTVEL